MWPVVLTSGEITLRPLRIRDRSQWNRVRAFNREWLTPWEATLPQARDGGESQIPSFVSMVRTLNREGRAGRAVSLGIWHENSLIGQITMGGIIYGAMRGAHIGYWIDQRYSNRGFTTAAVKALTDFAFQTLHLHRIEINLRPENEASRRVAEKAGYHLEGERSRYLHIDGGWRDHLSFVRENPEII